MQGWRDVLVLITTRSNGYGDYGNTDQEEKLAALVRSTHKRVVIVGDAGVSGIVILPVSE